MEAVALKPPTRQEILDRARHYITGPKQDEYGDAFITHQRIAWEISSVVGRDITATEAVLCQIGVKKARLSLNPTHVDSWIDLAGYAALGAEIAARELELEASDE